MRISPVRLPGKDKRKRRASAFARVLGWLFALAVIGGIGVTALGSWLYANYTAPGPLTQPAVVDVPKNLDRMAVANLLHDRGVVSNASTLAIMAVVQAYRGSSMKAGEYEFPAGASMADVFRIMASGRVVTYKMTVPEGWTSEMAVNRLKEQEPLAGDIAVIPPEGAVIANTYLYTRGQQRQQLLDQMVAAQTKLIDDVWAKRPADSLLKTKEEMVTLASIVEKETGKADERPRVAAVFLNRLKAGMRLQSDPTIIYGIVAGKGKLDRPITQADIDADTPYNTYRINGLPPGPIASPGKDALEAVINPAPVNDLYFVADGTGGHVFAATLEEHNANVKKWRAIEAGQAQASAAADPAAAPAQAPVAGQPAAAAADPNAPVQSVQQPALPDVPEEDVAATAAAPAVPAQPAATQPADAQPAAAAPAQGEAAAGEAAPGEQTAAADAPAVEAETKLKPGTFVKVGKALVPIPTLKKPKP